MINIKPTKLFTYNKSKHANSDPYGLFIFGQAREWAELMEKEITEKLPDHTWEDIVLFMKDNATPLSLETKHCKDGLTGFQQDCATTILVQCWEYGFELWLGLLLEKRDRNYSVEPENMKYVKMWTDKNYQPLLEFKESLG